ncbi:MAG: hypothetical protein EAX95_07060 [Candidatus Thorarchaeota archaeon]|nr:hypothetical protein [Candidatus Thorarchaeota archaeon]
MSESKGFQSVQEIRTKVSVLQTKLDAFDYCSEEFFEVYDKLKVLLDHGVQSGLREGNEEAINEFREKQNDLEHRVPSGYWK